MITYLTDPDLTKTAKDLSDKDLAQQFHDMQRILGLLATEDTGNINYWLPGVQMWLGYGDALFEFMLTIKDECDYRRIYMDSDWDNALKIFYAFPNGGILWPEWMDWDILHKDHRRRLFELDPQNYWAFAWDAIDKPVKCCADCEVLWPTHVLENDVSF